MLALDFLGVAFAWAVRVGGQMPAVGTPMIRVVTGQPKGLEQRFELQKNVVCAAPKDIGQDLAGVVIDGMPEPTGSSIWRRRCSASICWPFYFMLSWNGAMSHMHCFAKSWCDAKSFLRICEP